MNQSQTKYAMSRVSEIEKLKIAAVRAKHTVPAKKLTHKDQIVLIRGGKVKLREEVAPYDRLAEAFDFSKFESEEKINEAAIEKELSALKVAADKVRDAIMLGDESEAKALITAFANE